MTDAAARLIEPTIPLPPTGFMELVCGGERDDLTGHFLSVGKRLLAALHKHGLMFDSARMLDVGCGCGRVARHLVDEPLRTYTGFDRHLGMIDWCRQEISSRRKDFEFHYFDIKSSYQTLDGVNGRIDGAHFTFPFDDRSFDFALLSSVFTHMPLEEARHYLSELSRTLMPGGKALLSVFLNKEASHVDGINYYYKPLDFRNAVLSSGMKLTPDHWERLTFGDDYAYGYGHWQHNWFILQS